MTELTVTPVAKTGTEPTLAAADANGNSFSNSGRELLVVTNGGAGSVDLTLDSQRKSNQDQDNNVVSSIGAGETRLFAGITTKRFDDGSGKANLSFDSVASVTLGAFRVKDESHLKQTNV